MAAPVRTARGRKNEEEQEGAGKKGRCWGDPEVGTGAAGVAGILDTERERGQGLLLPSPSLQL